MELYTENVLSGTGNELSTRFACVDEMKVLSDVCD